MLASAILDTVAEDLTDETSVHWTRASLLKRLNAGQRQIVAVKPDACTAVVEVTLVAGVRQTITGLRVLDVQCNSGGRAISLISREIMADLNSGWMASAPASTIKHYSFDSNDPTAFMVCPPAVAGTKVMVLQSVLPVDCTDGGATPNIGLPDIYEMPLVDWVLYRSFLRDSEAADMATRATAHLNAFMTALTGKGTADQDSQPRTSYPNRIKPNAK